MMLMHCLNHLIRQHHFIPQVDQSNLVCDLNLLKNQAEPMVFRLKEWNLLVNVTKISLFHKSQKDFFPFFSHNSNLVYYNKCGLSHRSPWPTPQSKVWRLFTDFSRLSLEVVLIQNGNNTLQFQQHRMFI
jgi:hypothetical protein